MLPFLINTVSQQSVDTLSANIKERMSACLRDDLRTKSVLFRMVEKAHGTVTVKRAVVESCNILTLDGSNNAGIRGSNVASIKLSIGFYWDGILHKDGYTRIDFYIYVRDRRITVDVANTTAFTTNPLDLSDVGSVLWAIIDLFC